MIRVDADVLSAGVQLVALNLHQVEFKSSGLPLEDEDKLIIDVQLATSRPSDTDMIVLLAVRAHHTDQLDARVEYRARFRTADGEPRSGDDAVAFWQAVAAHLGPVVLYPYVRETIDGLAGRAWPRRFVLPVLNIGGAFDPNSIEIPDPEE